MVAHQRQTKIFPLQHKVVLLDRRAIAFAHAHLWRSLVAAIHC